MSFIKKLFGNAKAAPPPEEVPVYELTMLDGKEIARKRVVFEPPVEHAKPPIVSNLVFKNVSTFGIVCSPKDEKILMTRVNDYLALFDRTTSKAKNPNMLSHELPFVIKHFYWNLNKDTATWFDIKPNLDVEGKWYQPAHQNFAWLLNIRIDHSGWERVGELTAAKLQQTQDFLNGLLQGIAFETTLIMQTDDLFWQDKLK